MAPLATLANALLSADRAFRAFRAGSYFSDPYGQPVPISSGSTTIDLIDEGETVSFADAAESHPVVFAVINKLLRELATLDIGIFQRQRDQDGRLNGRETRVYGTTLEALLREPAPRLGLVDLLQWTFRPVLVEGNALVGKFRPDGSGTTPAALVPLDWRYLSAFARVGGQVEHWVSLQAGTPRILDPTEVVHAAWQAPSSTALGVSPLRPLADTVSVEDASRRFQRSSLRNGARPLGALVTDAKLEEPHKKALSDAANRNHRGVDQAFKIAILDGGLKWQPMSFSAADAQLDATRARSREEVCVAYDVRWSQMADPPSGATIDPGGLARDLHRTLRPWTKLVESVWQRQLIDREPEWADEDLTVRFLFTELLRGSPQEAANRETHLFTSGLTARDEGREALGYPPIGREQDKTPMDPHAQLNPASDGRALPPSTAPDAARAQLDRGPQPG